MSTSKKSDDLEKRYIEESTAESNEGGTGSSGYMNQSLSDELENPLLEGDKHTSLASISADTSHIDHIENKNTIDKEKCILGISKIFNPAVRNIEALDEGSDSQDEEILLRWDDDDEVDNERMEYDDPGVDEDALLEMTSHTAEFITHNIKLDDSSEISMKVERTGDTNKAHTKCIDALINKEFAQLGKQNSDQVKDAKGVEDIIAKSIDSSIVEEGANNSQADNEDLLLHFKDQSKRVDDKVNDQVVLKSCDGDNTVGGSIILGSSETTDKTRGLMCKIENETRNPLDNIIINQNSEIIDNGAKENIEESSVYNCVNSDVSKEQNETNVNMAKIDTENNKNNIPNVQMIPVSKTATDSPISKSNKEIFSEAIGNIENTTNIALDTDIKTDHSTKDDIEYAFIDLQKDTSNIKQEVESMVDQDLELSITPDVNTDHAINKPDIMLEIPNQELIDIDEADLTLGQDTSLGVGAQILKHPDGEDFRQDNESYNSSQDMGVDNIISRLGEDDDVESHFDRNSVENGASKEENNINDKTAGISYKSIDTQSNSKDNLISNITDSQTLPLKSNINKEEMELISDNINISDTSISQEETSQQTKEMDKPCKYYYYYQNADAQPMPIISNKEEDKSVNELLPENQETNLSIKDVVENVSDITTPVEVAIVTTKEDVTDNVTTEVNLPIVVENKSEREVIPEQQYKDLDVEMKVIEILSKSENKVTEEQNIFVNDVSTEVVTKEKPSSTPESISEISSADFVINRKIISDTVPSEAAKASQDHSLEGIAPKKDPVDLVNISTSVSEVSSSIPIETSTTNLPSDIPQTDSGVLSSATDTLQQKPSDVSEKTREPVLSVSQPISPILENVPNPNDVLDATGISNNTLSKDEPPITDPIASTSSYISSVHQTSSSAVEPDSEQTLEMQDSLGLLAESSRVMDYDDEIDEDECDDDEDMDVDDESSNHMTAEHSEDSNETHPEEVQKDLATESEKDNECDESSNLTTEQQEEMLLEEKENEGENLEDKEEPHDSIVAADKEDIQIEEDNEAESNEIYITEGITVENTTELSTKKDIDENKKIEIDIETSKTDQVPAKKKKIEDDKPAEVKSPEANKQSPSKMMKLMIAKQSNVFNIVDLEESSSEDDIQELPKDEKPPVQEALGRDVMTIVNIPVSEAMEIVETEPKSPLKEKANVTLKPTETPTESEKAVESISEATDKVQETVEVEKPKIDLEIFNLDSDEDDEAEKQKEKRTPIRQRVNNRCINKMCRSTGDVYYKPDLSLVTHYDATKNKKPLVCEKCVEDYNNNRQALVDAVKNMIPLLDLDMGKLEEECVEISDSDSEEEEHPIAEDKEIIGESGGKFLEENLVDLINDAWNKFKMDERLKEATDVLDVEFEKLDATRIEIDNMINDCFKETDRLRNELYATYDPKRDELRSIVILDTPEKELVCYESVLNETSEAEKNSSRSFLRDHIENGMTSQRVLQSDSGNTNILSDISLDSNKRRATRKNPIPLGYTPLASEFQKSTLENAQEPKSITPNVDKSSKAEEDKDVSVVQLSAEVAPPDLPPCGDVIKPPLKVGMTVYAVKNAFGAWQKAKILEVTPKGTKGMQYTMCKVKFEKTSKSMWKNVSARNLAYETPSDVRMTIGTRLIALFKDSANDGKKESFYSGIVAEVPNPVNNYRYLVFFDDGYAQYVLHMDTRLVCESSSVVWDEVHPFSREFVRKYLLAYPERPMVRLHAGQSLKTEWNGKWWASKVLKVDASLVQVHFEEDNRTEWIYRGSTRLAPLYLELQAAERHRNRPLPRSKAQPRTNMPYVEYTRSDEQNSNKEAEIQAQQRQQDEIRRQRAVAKKSTTTAPVQTHQPPSNFDPSLNTRVVYYTPKNAVKPYKMVAHNCSTKCRRTDVLGLHELRTYNPLAKPLLSGWQRQIVRYKGQREVMYRAPCGRRLRNMPELHAYLRAIQSDMAVDLFDFHPNTHCLAEFVITKCLVGKKDLSHGRENVPVPCVNTLDETLPEFCSYNTERTPTAGVPLNLDPEFLCGCDCTDDCEDKSKCACWQMTLEGAKTIGLEGPNVGYSYKRLPEPLPSGIYECNSRCKCKNTCLNRVAQHPLQLKLQVFKTLSRGWGIRALNDVPAGAFLCVYAGNLLTDATANLDGLNEGDEYLAELDYIEVVEQMKEGYEDDIPDADKKLDQEDQNGESDDEPSSEEEDPSQDDKQDGDFTPTQGCWSYKDTEHKKTLRKREKKEKKKEKEAKEANQNDDCITISDDEEVREPSRFTAQPGMGGKEFVPKYRSVRAHFGKDEACYIMDAKVQGNIGRYLNHSCSPNVFVQNVFVDTHDPRFPWVAFFALCHIRAGTELTWNYNYDVGSVPGKILYCHCGAANCRGRLL